MKNEFVVSVLLATLSLVFGDWREETKVDLVFQELKDCYVCTYGVGNIRVETGSGQMELINTDKCRDRVRIGYEDPELIRSCGGACMLERTRIAGEDFIKRYCRLEPIDDEFQVKEECTTYHRPGATTTICACHEWLCNNAYTLFLCFPLLLCALLFSISL